ncbi:unnamed protein product [Chrysoparadoxa australica]
MAPRMNQGECVGRRDDEGWVAPFFNIVEPLTKEKLLSVMDEVVAASLQLFAPLGLPCCQSQVCPDEATFLELTEMHFRGLSEGVSEAIYGLRGVCESEMAITIHKFVEELKDPEVIAALTAMTDAVKVVYAPPRVLELPGDHDLPSASSISALASTLQDAKVLPMTQGPGMGESSAAISTGNRGKGCRCSTAAVRSSFYPEVYLALGFRPALQGVNQGADSAPHSSLLSQRDMDESKFRQWIDVGSKAHKEHVTSHMKVLLGLQTSNPCLLPQQQLQAIVEAYRAGENGGLLRHEKGQDNEAESVQEHVKMISQAAAKSFLFNPLLTMAASRSSSRPPSSEVEPVNATHSTSAQCQGRYKGDEEEDEWTAVVRSAEEFKAQGDVLKQSKQLSEAVEAYTEAIREGFGYLPDSRLAQHLGSRGLCHIDQGGAGGQLALDDAEAALRLDEACAIGYEVRGRIRYSDGQHQEAVDDLITAFVLDPGRKAEEYSQLIEDVTREACRAKAKDLFRQKEVPIDVQPESLLPGAWLCTSYFEAFVGDTPCRLEGLGQEAEEEDEFAVEVVVEKDVGSTAKALELLQQSIVAKESRRYCESYRLALQALTCLDEQQALSKADVDSDAARIRSITLEYIGCYRFLSGDMSASLSALEEAVTCDTSSVLAKVKLAAVLSDLDDSEAALELFDEALKLSPKDVTVLLHRGQLHLLQNDLRAAIRDLKVARDAMQYTATGAQLELVPPPALLGSLGIALFKMALAQSSTGFHGQVSV